jgi:broad specificity polyphosphatase/5'/3'-nucleotidase SurE
MAPICVERGCVSVTPLQIDLTHSAQIGAIESWIKS